MILKLWLRVFVLQDLLSGLGNPSVVVPLVVAKLFPVDLSVGVNSMLRLDVLGYSLSCFLCLSFRSLLAVAAEEHEQMRWLK